MSAAPSEQDVFFDMSPDMFLVATLDGVIVKANAALGRALQVDPLALAGQSIEDVVFDEDKLEAQAFAANLVQGGEADALLRLRQDDGTIRSIRWTGRGLPILEVVYVSGRDVTAELALSDELTRSNRDLEQFAYLASHDLQAPLRTVRGFSDLLIARIQANGGKMDDDAERYARLVDAAVDRMEKLIRGLLAFARVETGPAEHSEVDLQRLCNQVVMALTESIQRADAVVSVEGLPTVLGDADQLSSVLQNLIENAIKYRHPERRPVIAVSAIAWDSWWTISVRDNGIGVDPRLADRAFQMFRQLHPEGTYEGIGFGLALARRIIEHHGGAVNLDSDGESGTTVTFTLPAGLRGART